MASVYNIQHCCRLSLAVWRVGNRRFGRGINDRACYRRGNMSRFRWDFRRNSFRSLPSRVKNLFVGKGKRQIKIA